jgi:hypothetical protein
MNEIDPCISNTFVNDNTIIESTNNSITFELLEKKITVEKKSYVLFRLKIKNESKPKSLITLNVDPFFLVDDITEIYSESEVEIKYYITFPLLKTLLCHVSAKDEHNNYGSLVYRFNPDLFIQFKPIPKQMVNLLNGNALLKIYLEYYDATKIYRIQSFQSNSATFHIENAEKVFVTKKYNNEMSETLEFIIWDLDNLQYIFQVDVVVVEYDYLRYGFDKDAIIQTLFGTTRIDELKPNDIVICADGRRSVVKEISSEIVHTDMKKYKLNKDFFKKGFPFQDTVFLEGTLIFNYWINNFVEIQELTQNEVVSTDVFYNVTLNDFKTDYLVVNGIACEALVKPKNRANLFEFFKSFPIVLRNLKTRVNHLVIN